MSLLTAIRGMFASGSFVASLCFAGPVQARALIEAAYVCYSSLDIARDI